MKIQPVVLFIVFLTCASCSSDIATMLEESEKCAQSSNVWSCLKKFGSKIVGAMVTYQGDIPLMGSYLTVMPYGNQIHDEGRSITSENNMNFSSVFSKLMKFVTKRSLRIILPMNFIAWLFGATGSEGRKKTKGGGALILGGTMMIATLMSTAFGAMAMMAGKALLTSMLALMLSAMAVTKKSGGHGHARTTYEITNIPHGYHQISDYKLENTEVVSDVSKFE